MSIPWWDRVFGCFGAVGGVTGGMEVCGTASVTFPAYG
jgi:hypothetical protein